MQLTCEWCGQPAVRQEPPLCAECFYKFWSKTKESPDLLKARVDGTVYSR
jgi:hypothetical protein